MQTEHRTGHGGGQNQTRSKQTPSEQKEDQTDDSDDEQGWEDNSKFDGKEDDAGRAKPLPEIVQAFVHYVSAAKFRKAIHALGYLAPNADVDAVFAMVDTDKSGAVTYKELRKLLPKTKAEALKNRRHLSMDLQTKADDAERKWGGGARHVHARALESVGVGLTTARRPKPVCTMRMRLF